MSFDGLGRPVKTAWYRNGATAPDYYEDYVYTLDEPLDARSTRYGGGEYLHQIYDEAGRTGLEVYDDLNAIRFRYDASGNVTQKVDELGRSTIYRYDGLNRRIAATTPDGVTVTNQFDADGNATNALQPYGIAYVRRYDPRGRMTSERVASGGSTLFNHAFGYDLAGNLATQTTARGVTIASTFDALDRRTALSASAPTPLIPSVSQAFSYTPNGWLSGATEGARGVARSFDQNGRPLSETNNVDGSVLAFGQTFDAEGRRITCRVSPAVEAWTNQWNGHGRLTNIQWNGSAFSHKYDNQSRVQTLTGPYLKFTNQWIYRHFLIARYNSRASNGSWVYADASGYRADGARYYHQLWYDDEQAVRQRDYAYDALNQLTQETVEAGAAWNTNRFAYDAAQTRTNALKYTATGAWQRASAVDALRRLTTESTTLAGSNPVITVSGFVLDSTNVLVKLNGTNLGYAAVDTNSHRWSISGVTLAGGSNTLTATAEPSEEWATNAASVVTLNLNVRGSYVYDADGNVVYINRGNKNYALGWDALGRLASVAVRDGGGNGLDWSAAYDAFGRRVQTTTQTVSNNAAAGAATVETVLYDPACELAEVLRLGTGSTNFHLYGPDLSDAYCGLGGIGGLIATRQSGTVYQVASDLRGNVIALVNSGGTATFQPRYTAFGPASAPTLGVPGYSTRRYDPTGFIFMGARMYDPVTGRFLSIDPAHYADGRNLYALVGHQPINRVDPDGRLGKGAGTSVRDMAVGTGQLLWNVGGSIGYGASSMVSPSYAQQTYGSQMSGLKATGAGLAQLGSSLASGNLGAVGQALTGGENRSAAFRAGYAAATIGTLLVGGGEASAASRAGQVGRAGEAAGQAVRSGVRIGEDLSSATGTRVWRNIPEGHPALADAQAGIIKPYGTTMSAPLDVRALAHDTGYTHGSGLTSWTADQTWAISRQQRLGGSVIETMAPEGSIWFNQAAQGAESQVMIPGIVRPR